jgi:hypothetical protein
LPAGGDVRAPPAQRTDCPSKSREEGFGLLEGLVAIALLAGTLVAIFGLVGNLLSSAYRVARSNASVQVTLNALEVMTVVNPMVQETGKVDLGPYTVSWMSAALTPVTDRAGSLYQIGLYQSDVRVEEPPDLVLARFSLRQIGYRRVRDPGLIFGDQGAR